MQTRNMAKEDSTPKQDARSEKKSPSKEEAPTQSEKDEQSDLTQEEGEQKSKRMNKALLMWAVVALLALYLISTTMQSFMRIVESVRSKYV